MFSILPTLGLLVQRKGMWTQWHLCAYRGWKCCLCRYFRPLSHSSKSCLLLFVVFPDLVQGRVVEWAEPEHSLGWDQGLGHCGCNKVAWSAVGGQHCFPGAVWVSDNNGHHLPSWTTSQTTSVSLDKVFSQDLVTLDTLLSCVWSE